MFITSKEKERMVDAILKLQQQVKELEEKFAKSYKVYTPEEAPYGVRANGMPRKKPGRPSSKKVQS
jgi:hypothetical protein